MFPGSNQVTSIAPLPPNPGYDTNEQRQRSYQSFPVYKSGHQGGHQHQGYAQHQVPDPASSYHQGYGQSQTFVPSQGQIQPGTYPQPGYQQGYQQGRGTIPQQGYRPPQYAGEEPYVTDYTASYPQNQGPYGYGSGSGQYANEHPNILRSKVLELKE